MVFFSVVMITQDKRPEPMTEMAEEPKKLMTKKGDPTKKTKKGNPTKKTQKGNPTMKTQKAGNTKKVMKVRKSAR